MLKNTEKREHFFLSQILGWPPYKDRSLSSYVSKPHDNILSKAVTGTCGPKTLEDALGLARLIIAVKSGVNYQERRQSNRDTWIADAVIIFWGNEYLALSHFDT